jgi:hypothetical protein
MREMSFDERTQTTYVARDITITSDHLLRTAHILELAYQQEPTSTVWAVRSDGQLLGLTYDLSEQIVAWWRFVTAGQVESVATIPHPTANAHQVWLTAQRTIGVTETRSIEVLDPDAVMTLPTPVEMFNELTQETETIAGWEGLTVDAAKVYANPGSATLTGLGHLNGATVAIVADGAVFPSQVVQGGQVTLPSTPQSAFVGLPYLCRGKCLPVDLNLRGTTGQRVKKRFVKIVARVENAACLVVHGERIPFRQPHMAMDQGVALFSGDKEVTPLGWSGMGVIDFAVDQPLPCTVVGLIALVDQEAER